MTDKRSSGGHSPIRTILLLALLAFAAYYAYQSLFPRATYSGRAMIASGTLGDSYEGDALIVRNEVVYGDEGVSNIEYVAEEGGRVARSSEICRVYTSGYSTKELTTLQNYRDQIETYQQSLIAAETTYDQKMQMLENDVLQRALEVRNLVKGASGNMINQEKLLTTAITARQNYLRSKYSGDQKMTRLYDDENAQQMKINGWVKTYTTSYDAVVSFYADGYEPGLNSNTFADFTPAQVRSMINGNLPETTAAQRGKTDIYRLVRDGTYYVLMLIQDSTFTPAAGETYQLMLEQFSTTVVDAYVLSASRAGGELLVRLQVDAAVDDVLYMRTCSASLGKYVEALMVPKECLFTQDGTTGVVVEKDGQQLYVPVSVITTQNGYAYIVSNIPGYLQVGETVLTF